MGVWLSFQSTTYSYARRSVTLVGEADRRILRAAIKHAAAEDQVRHRVLPVEAQQHWSDKLIQLKDEISDVLREEKEEKQLRQAEMELKKGQNIIEYQDEIFSRPARTWFQTGKEKQAAQGMAFLSLSALRPCRILCLPFSG